MGRALAGAWAGALATVAMSACMFGAKRLGLLGQMPPERITARVLNAAGVRRGRRTQDLVSSLAHVGFGAGAGAVFGAAQPSGRTSVLRGIAFGSAVWAISYAGWIPALGIMPPPSRDRPGQPQTMLAAHWIYGATLALVARGGRPSAWHLGQK